MPIVSDDQGLRIKLESKHREIAPEEITAMEAALRPLRRVINDFPLSDLYVTIIQRPEDKDCHVKTTLRLPSTMLFTGETQPAPVPAFERCIRKLVNKVGALKEELSNKPQYSKEQAGTVQEMAPAQEADVDGLEQAVRSGDYLAFRRKMAVYEEQARLRAGRWIQRYPDLEAKLGNDFTISDIVEEIFLNAFEEFSHRPRLPVSQWLENHLLDEAMHDLRDHPDAVKENVSFAQTLQTLAAP